MTSTIGAPAPDDIFTDHLRWADVDAWNRAALGLHERGGIHRVERDGFAPIWAVIDHAAVLDVERQPALFTNEPEPVLIPTVEAENRQFELKTLIHVDDPLHAQLRGLTADWFKPSSVRRLDDRLAELANEALAKMRSFGDRCDFAVDIALPFPLQVILRILGLPEDDYGRMLTLTQELFGGQDPDLQRDGEDPAAALAEVVADFFAYFTALTADRRANPGDDLATLIANGQIDDAPLGDLETLGYYVIVATAGHDTTSSAMSGGMLALIEHQDQLRLLQDDPELLNNAVEEMIRWTAPVRHFMRTAQEDTEILGQEIRKGDWLYLSYKAANLDPKVFDDPLTFDITRPNAAKNISFGYGVHFCLGAQLARNELRHLFGRLVPEIESIELDGAASSMSSTFVGGLKTLPIRYTLRPA
ncbi:MAG: cytochrome P450 [Actinomycetota bacterium]